MKNMGITFFIKRLFDIFLAVIGLVVAMPFMIFLAAMIKVDSKGPIIYKQERIGYQGNVFEIYKLRTMVDGALHMGNGYFTEENDARITKIGRFLRKWSIDEIPQLFNVLKGEMSLVGPRPALLYQLEEYDETQKKRLCMKPGLTGWAQINGRNTLTWTNRIKFDIWYVQNWSFVLDIKILIATIFIVVKQDGIYGQLENSYIKNKDYGDMG